MKKSPPSPAPSKILPTFFAIFILFMLNGCETFIQFSLHSAEDVNFDAWQVQFNRSKPITTFSFGPWRASGLSSSSETPWPQKNFSTRSFQFVLESPTLPSTIVYGYLGSLYGQWEGVVWDSYDPFCYDPTPDYVTGRGWLNLRPGLRAQFWAGGKLCSVEFVPGGRSSPTDWGQISYSWQTLRIVHVSSFSSFSSFPQPPNGHYLQIRHGYRILGALDLSPTATTVYISRDAPPHLQQTIAAAAAAIIAPSLLN
ncbi:MAG: hypothetical protein N2035_04305 [Chthoniobacterales bacterium]|nr:hypothetical protein [Chthoniobacterales bacterium]